MSLKKIQISSSDDVFIADGNKDGFGCGTVNDDGKLYLIDEKNKSAYLLPEKYWQTPLYLIPPCGGYRDGRIMVSLLGRIKLQYFHELYGAAGLWGWIDLEGNEIISPQYLFALHFSGDTAVVCKGEWSVDENGEYWCDNELWGEIDRNGNEVTPFRFNEINNIENTERYMFCHEGGWEKGYYCIYDKESGEVISKLDFDFDISYMFNECFFENGLIVFDEHIPGKETDYIYAYSIEKRKWVVYREEIKNREFNGKSRMSVNKDGEEIIIF